eukprot:9369992-Karenia_brevis.AAC.1
MMMMMMSTTMIVMIMVMMFIMMVMMTIMVTMLPKNFLNSSVAAAHSAYHQFLMYLFGKYSQN